MSTSLESDLQSLLEDFDDDWITSYEFKRSVSYLVDRERKRRLRKTSPFDLLYFIYLLLTNWKIFVGPFFAFHLLVPLTPLGKSPEVFGFGTTPWCFTVLPVSLFFSFVFGLVFGPIMKRPSKASKNT